MGSLRRPGRSMHGPIPPNHNRMVEKDSTTIRMIRASPCASREIDGKSATKVAFTRFIHEGFIHEGFTHERFTHEGSAFAHACAAADEII
jgi:hypothetical protein